MIWKTLSMALREIYRNRMRSLLTALGIIIGVAAVIAMVSLGQAATNRVTADIKNLGNNMVIVSPGSVRQGPTSAAAAAFDLSDAQAIEREVTAALMVAPTANRGVLAVYGNKNCSSVATGTTGAFLEVRGFAINRGRGFSDADMRGGSVCILGETVRKELFGNQNPVGASIRVANFACTVVGTLEPKGRSTFGNDQDDFLLVPLRTLQRRIAGNTDVGSIFVSAASERHTGRVVQQIERLLRERRRILPGQKDDFTVQDMKEITATVQSATGVLTLLLGAIAGVSLIVGGIGIMNIMLVSVTERTREIGIRLAIGAEARDVLLQFLVEATVLSTFGGLIGIGLGLLGSWAAAYAAGLPFSFLPEVVLLAFGFSLAVGVGFGFYPARRAANLHPIEALRHE